MNDQNDNGWYLLNVDQIGWLFFAGIAAMLILTVAGFLLRKRP
jgi:LPXTG-motif cell wall-anchored protein